MDAKATTSSMVIAGLEIVVVVVASVISSSMGLATISNVPLRPCLQIVDNRGTNRCRVVMTFRSLLDDDDNDDGSASKRATGKADDVFVLVAAATTTTRCVASLAALFRRLRLRPFRSFRGVSGLLILMGVASFGKQSTTEVSIFPFPRTIEQKPLLMIPYIIIIIIIIMLRQMKETLMMLQIILFLHQKWERHHRSRRRVIKKQKTFREFTATLMVSFTSGIRGAKIRRNLFFVENFLETWNHPPLKA
jgi:hypothetical protein